jgi:hypothetical protein
MSLPPVKKLWDNYPDTHSKEEVAVAVGGSVAANIREKDWETCCIRLSLSLTLSGQPIEGFARMANSYIVKNGTVRAGKGADNKWYIYSCYDMRVYLQTRFGMPKKFGSYEKSDLSSVKGVIMFAFRHVDVWDGTAVKYNTDFTDGTKTVSEILVWPAP